MSEKIDEIVDEKLRFHCLAKAITIETYEDYVKYCLNGENLKKWLIFKEDILVNNCIYWNACNVLDNIMDRHYTQGYLKIKELIDRWLKNLHEFYEKHELLDDFDQTPIFEKIEGFTIKMDWIDNTLYISVEFPPKKIIEIFEKSAKISKEIIENYYDRFLIYMLAQNLTQDYKDKESYDIYEYDKKIIIDYYPWA